jgi:hypothetical protein
MLIKEKQLHLKNLLQDYLQSRQKHQLKRKQSSVSRFMMQMDQDLLIQENCAK